jgi:hypothetical protein
MPVAFTQHTLGTNIIPYDTPQHCPVLHFAQQGISPSSSSMEQQPEVEPWPPLNKASKLAYLEILFSSF